MRVFTERLADFDLRRPASKREYNRRVFQAVAPRYGAVTRLLSFGMDTLWKRALVRRLPAGQAAGWPGTGAARPGTGASRPQSGVSPRALDLACGTGDLSLLLARRFPGARIDGLDLSPAMIARARRRPGAGGVCFRIGDLSRLPYPAASFRLVTGGYALRNAPDLSKSLREVFRVLKKGGTAAFLDFNRSPVPWRGRLQVRLLAVWGGLWGLLLHGNPEVYAYIAESLALFPDRARFEALLEELGFRRVRSRLPPGGFVSLTFAVKP
jgi:demethylmenaquinone methyltransferase/2-methoxy-6-polyprenyl-1,4-benzoquinol methylase